MKAWVLKEYNQPMELAEIETPDIKDDEILLRVKACGICQTDLKIYRGEIPPPIVTLPHTPGHEVAGEVVAVGSRVDGIKEKDIGIVYIYIPCHACTYCLSGRENLCPDLKRIGFELPGGYAQFIRIPSYAFCSFEKRIPFEEMAILGDAVATSYRALTVLAEVKAGHDVLIVGAGGLGIHGVQIAKLCGARVLVADIKEKALRLAKEFGADFLINSGESPGEQIKDLTGGKGVDAVLEFVGSEKTMGWSLPSLKKGGKLVIVGYVPGKTFPLNTMAMHYNEWKIFGSRLCTKVELLEVIRLVEEGKIKPVISKTFPLEKANEALQAVQSPDIVGRIALKF